MAGTAQQRRQQGLRPRRTERREENMQGIAVQQTAYRMGNAGGEAAAARAREQVSPAQDMREEQAAPGTEKRAEAQTGAAAQPARKKSPCAKCGGGCVIKMCPRWQKWFAARWQEVRMVYGKGEED